jgi:hypothetical protein
MKRQNKEQVIEEMQDTSLPDDFECCCAPDAHRAHSKALQRHD